MMRIAAISLILAGLTAVAGCAGGSGEISAAKVECSRNFWGTEKSCTASFERRAAAPAAYLLGHKFELVRTEDERATLKIDGRERVVTMDDDEDGPGVVLESISRDWVVISYSEADV